MSMDENAKQPKRAFGRSLTDFENLSDAEKKLIDYAASGQPCQLGENVPEAPAIENLVRPELIRFLALGGDDDAPVHEKGVQLMGAWIGAGPGEDPRGLDFDGSELVTSLRLKNCLLQSPPIFIGAQGKTLLFDGSILPSIVADRLKLDGNLFLRSVRSNGTVRLLGAVISGNLECNGSQFEKKGGLALLCDGVRVDGDIFLNFFSIQNPQETRCFRATGQVSLIGATIRGDLDCSGGYFQNEMGTALTLERASIGGSVFCNKGFHATGEVRLNAATIAVNLACDGGRFHNEGGRALTCDGAKIDGGVFFKVYHNPSQDQKLPFQAIGEVRLSRVDVGKDLDCSGGHFENKGEKNTKKSLLCDGARISGNIFCSDEFHANGELNFIGASIGGDLSFRRAYLENMNGMALSCERTNVEGVLFFREVAVLKGFISFAHTTVGTLVDALVCWPDNSLNLDGFRYDRIDAIAPLDARSRIEWLNRQVPQRLIGDTFAIQPWIHLAKVLREQGHFREAAEVDIAREERLRAAGKIGDRRALLSWAEKWGQLDSEGHYVSFLQSLSEQIAYWLHWFYGWFSGYGHRPVKIAYFAVAIWLVLASVYAIEDNYGHFTTANSSLTKTQFNPWAYSLDLILPVVQLGEFAKWTHVSDGSWITLSGWTGFLIYFEKIFGWISALTLAAIAAGLVKRKDG